MKDRPWVLRDYDPQLVELIKTDLSLDHLTALLVHHRHEGCYKRWIDPTLLAYAPNPLILPDIDRLLPLLAEVKSVGISTDYDVDGVTSAVMWRLFLEKMGKGVKTYVPDRRVGYGANEEGLVTLKGCDLLLFLDCGTDQHSVLKQASVPTAVIDHHLVKNPSPPSSIFINPRRPDADPDKMAPFLSLCTGGLSLLAIAWLASHLEKKFAHPKFDYRQLLDLAALATVADVMPLQGFNRAIVRRGLELINMGSRPPIKGLLRSGRVVASDLAFCLAPKINAAGRMLHANRALDLFAAEEPEPLIMLIEKLNLERQAEESRIFQEALQLVEEGENQACKAYNGKAVLVFAPHWNLGVVGIVASRLKERYYKPAFVLAGEGPEVKGSARSIKEVDLGHWIQECLLRRIITSGGGHGAAGGLSLSRDKIDELIEFLEEMPQVSPPPRQVDAFSSLSALSRLHSLHKLEPFGSGNPSPTFWIPEVRVESFRPIKEVHASLVLTDTSGKRLRAMAFNLDPSLLLGKKRDAILSYTGKGYLLVEAR